MRILAPVIMCCAIVACYRSPAAPTEPHAKPAPPREALVAAGPHDGEPRLSVAGCNSGCENCSLADYNSFVIGTLDRTGAQLFPSPDPPQPGYQCGAEVAIGERVTLRAHTTVGLSIAAWKPFFATDACPCTTPSNVCTFVVTPEIAAHYTRIYCGAIWQLAAAQIGR